MGARSSDHNLDRTFDLAEKALSAIREHRSPAYPRAFEVWYAHLSGETPALSGKLEDMLASGRPLTPGDIDLLYDTYVDQSQFVRQTERTSMGVLAEIDGVMDMIETALGSSARYGESLEALSEDLNATADRNKIREIVESLVRSTQEVAATNKHLENRLNEGRNEINQLREALEATRADALTDALTELANRRHFEQMLQKSIDQATLQRQPFALIIADIDFFKRFNDQHGHLTGDQVLRLVGATMKAKLKSSAIPCRYGGEEFAVILPQADLIAGRVGAETIRQALLARELVKRSTGETLGRVTLTLGVAVYRRGDTAASLIERADNCLLLGKREGRNRTITEDRLNDSEQRVA